MPQVTFIEHNGKQHSVTATEGLSLMRAAIDNNVPGIDADCGGMCACATCHVYVDAAWEGRTGERTAMEKDMLRLCRRHTGQLAPGLPDSHQPGAGWPGGDDA